MTRALAVAALLAAMPAFGATPSLAQCLSDNGFVMYGASWCPYCAKQLKLFGADAKNLNYVECSADGVQHGKPTAICEKKGIDNFPTWRFNDGMLHVGIRTRRELAAISGCPLD